MNVGLLSSASALAVVGYTGTVIYHGNLVALLDQLAADKAFLAWMAAVGILYVASKQPEIGGPVRLIAGVAVLALLLRIFSNGGAGSALSNFANGQSSLAEAFIEFSAAAGSALGIHQPEAANNLPTMSTGVATQ